MKSVVSYCLNVINSVHDLFILNSFSIRMYFLKFLCNHPLITESKRHVDNQSKLIIYSTCFTLFVKRTSNDFSRYTSFYLSKYAICLIEYINFH